MNRIIVESLNIGLPKKELFGGREFMTGICKSPVPGPLRLGKSGFEGDGVGDLKHHGGPDKAVCVYSTDHYPHWEGVLGTVLPPAPFGENLSVSGLTEDAVCIGDVFAVGTALVQVSQPRQPCKTLAARYGRSDLIKLVTESGRTGFYLRVLREGTVEKGAVLIPQEKDAHGITVAFANRILHHDRSDCPGISRVLEVPALSASWRKSFLELREKCT